MMMMIRTGSQMENKLYTESGRTLQGSFSAWRGVDTVANLQKLKVPEISSGPSSRLYRS